MYLKLTSESCGPSRSSSSSISNFKQSLALRYCFIFAITVLSRALRLLPCTSISVCHCISSIEECELCCGVATSSSFWMSVVLSLVSLRNSSLLDSAPDQSSAFWRKKRTAFQQIPDQNRKQHLHTSQPPPRKGTQAHQSQQAHPSKSQDHSQISHKDHPTDHTKNYHSSPSPPLDKKTSKASVETGLTHHL